MICEDLLTAAIPAILGVKVAHGPEGEGLPKLTIRNLFHCTYMPRSEQSAEPRFEVLVKNLCGKTITISVTGDDTISELKAAVRAQLDVDLDQQRFIFDGRQLEDHRKISDYNIQHDSTIHMVLRLRGGGPGQPKPRFDLQLDTNELDPSFNYDFSNKVDDGKTFMRGGKPYKRPYGWMRFAIKVLDVYESNTWLGLNGIRTEEVPGEWPVSYHGTKFQSTNAILRTGFKIGPRDKFGRAFYSSPSLEMVEKYYDPTFEFQGEKWKVVFQNRVNPDPKHLKIIPAQETGVGAEYWLSPIQDIHEGVYDARPYGILFKKV